MTHVPKPTSARSAELPSWLFDVLRCPHTSESLTIADDSIVAKLIQRQGEGKLTNCIGAVCNEVFDGGLVNASGTKFFPVCNSIVNLLPGDAIELGED